MPDASALASIAFERGDLLLLLVIIIKQAPKPTIQISACSEITASCRCLHSKRMILTPSSSSSWQAAFSGSVSFCQMKNSSMTYLVSEASDCYC